MMTHEYLQTFYETYPERVQQLIVKTREHGDPIYAAYQTQVKKTEWIKELLAYSGSREHLAQARDSLLDAITAGMESRSAFAKQLFINTLAKHASIPEAVSSQPWYDRSHFESERIADPDFALAWDTAMETAIDSLRVEAWRRAVEGVAEPQVYQGQFTFYTDEETGERRQVTVRKYSDALLQNLLKRYDPAFNESINVNQTTQVNGELDTSSQVLAQLSVKELAVLDKLIELQPREEEETILQIEAPPEENEPEHDPTDT